MTLVFLSLALVVGVFLVTPYLAWRWISQPFIGAFIEPNLVFNGVGSPDWALSVERTVRVE